MPKNKKDEKPIQEEKFQQLDVNAKDPRTVVLMLDSPEAGIICKACQSLQQYMEKTEQNRAEMHGLGVIPRLVKLLGLPDKVVYACAVIALAVMVPNVSVKKSLLKSEEFLQSLFKMLKPDEEVYILERVTFIVANLAEEYTFKRRLVDEGCCQLLLPLVSHADCDVVKHVLKGLSLLTTHHTARKVIASDNGFPTLFQQLDSEYAEVQELVLHTLEHSLHDAQCRASFNSAEGLAKITEFLNAQEWNDLHVLAVEVLSLYLVEDNGMEALHSSNCLQRLLQSISDSQQPQMKAKAAQALGNASRDDVSKKILHEQEAEKTFIELLSSQDENVVIAACEGLKGLATLTSSRQYVGKEGGVKALVGLLQNPNGNIRASAVETLSSVINETIANCNLISEVPGGIEGLVSLLSDDIAQSRCSTAECIIAMSPSGTLRSSLVQNGAMEGLAGCLSHADGRVLSCAAQAIALLSVDSMAREKFPPESIALLLELLLSTNTEVCRNSAWALAVLAQSRNIVDAVFAKKGAETLWKLSEESKHKEVREYTMLALRRLLSGSPAAKYNLTKALSPQDTIVESEFWDMGMAEAVGFVPLEQLLSQPADMNRPVIAVSLVNKPQPPQSAASAENEEESSAVGTRGKEDGETSSTRSKSRQANNPGRESNKSVGKRTTAKEKQTSEQRQSSPNDESGTVAGQDIPSLAGSQGVLSPDPELWEHINYVKDNVQNLELVQNQAERLAVYVSQAMGGPLSVDNPLQYELPLAEIQGSTNCSIVPLGMIKKGTFQHRALLYKVLADQLGIPCSLQRGNYGRHWNTVMLEQNEMLVDLIFTPSKLWPVNSPEALRYQTV